MSRPTADYDLSILPNGRRQGFRCEHGDEERCTRHDTTIYHNLKQPEESTYREAIALCPAHYPGTWVPV